MKNRVFSTWGGKTNKVAKRHRRRFLLGGFASMVFGKYNDKNDRRGNSMGFGRW